MYQDADNLQKIFVTHVFNTGLISVCPGIDTNSKILNYATPYACWNTLSKCFSSLFQLSKIARLPFVHFSFSSTSLISSGLLSPQSGACAEICCSGRKNNILQISRYSRGENLFFFRDQYWHCYVRELVCYLYQYSG